MNLMKIRLVSLPLLLLWFSDAEIQTEGLVHTDSEVQRKHTTLTSVTFEQEDCEMLCNFEGVIFLTEDEC